MPNNIQIPDFIGQFKDTMSGIGDGMFAVGKYKLEKDAQDERQALNAGLVKDERDFKLLTAKNLSESQRSLAKDDREFRTKHADDQHIWATERDDRLRTERNTDNRETEKIAAETERKDRIAKERSLLKMSYDKMTMDSIVAEAKVTGTSMAFLESLKDEEGNYPPDTARRMAARISEDGTEKVMLLEKERNRKVMQIIAFEKGSTDRTVVDPQIMEARRLGVQNTYADSATEALLVKWLGAQQATLMLDGIRLGLDTPPAEIDSKTGKITKPGMIRNANVLQSIALSKKGGAWFGTAKHEDQREIYKKLIQNINLQTEGMDKTNKQVLSAEVIFLKQALTDLEKLNEQSMALKKYHPLRNALLEDEYNKAMESIVTPASAQNSTMLADVGINAGVNEHSFKTVDPGNEMGLTDEELAGSGAGGGGETTAEDAASFVEEEQKTFNPNAAIEQGVDDASALGLARRDARMRGRELTDSGHERIPFGLAGDQQSTTPELPKIAKMRDEQRGVEKQLHEIMAKIENPVKFRKVPVRNKVQDPSDPFGSSADMFTEKVVPMTEMEVIELRIEFRRLAKLRKEIQAKIKNMPESESVDEIRAEHKRLEAEEKRRLEAEAKRRLAVDRKALRK